MKNYDETINAVMDRIDQYEAAQKRKRKVTARIAASLCCICLVAFAGFGVWKDENFNTTPSATLGDSSVTGETGTPSNHETETQGNDAVILPPDFPVIWGEGNENDYGMTEWKGKTIGSSLYEALCDSTDDQSIFAIAAGYRYVDSQFSYNGKTLAEYAAEAEQEERTLGMLLQLLKEGDYLKYGEALYQTGTPEGEKWTKEFYDKTVASYGEEMLSKYIVDGAFLREKVESDIAVFSENRAQKAYKMAYDAYMDQILETAQEQLLGQNINCERRTEADYLIIYVSADEFAALSLYDISEWYFNLASKNHDDGQDLEQVVADCAE